MAEAAHPVDVDPVLAAVSQLNVAVVEPDLDLIGVVHCLYRTVVINRDSDLTVSVLYGVPIAVLPTHEGVVIEAQWGLEGKAAASNGGTVLAHELDRHLAPAVG